MTVDAVLGFTSVAGSLEPLAGAALAINLAYLGLTRFRYRDQIRKAAEQQRKVFEPADKRAPDNIRSMKNYKQLCDLCDLSNFDIEDVPNANKGARINGGAWSWLYHHLYRKHKDRYITYLFVGLSGFTLCAGVAKSLETWYYVNYLYHPNAGPIWLYLLMLAAASPVFFVWVGRKIVYYASEHARECREEIELAMQTGPANATIPVAASNVVTIEHQAAASAE
jgi:hypothetical protein